MGKRLMGLAFLLGTLSVTHAQLPPVPAPSENPVTEAKRALGKILFWDEQLSSDGTVACGTCHLASSGGVDSRVGLNPGPDGIPGTPDDILASPGVVRADAEGNPIVDEVFGTDVQVTGRTSMATVNAAYVPEAFWDGRAGTTFIDPETDQLSIAGGGALENQTLGPILSSVEMAHEGRDWDDVRAKLVRCSPLGDATDVPADLKAVLAPRPTYAELFEDAFGDDAITAERIAFAIASYERTLISDETPWDLFMQGDPGALTPGQQAGWNFFRNSPCSVCHTPPLFTNQTYRNIGIRPPAEDPGRQEVTGLNGDRGRFKVPTLRNVGLKPNHMHNGQVPDVTQAALWYRPGNPLRSLDNLDPLLPVPVPPQALPALVDFLSNGLTDPRVADETFPFDRPELHRGAPAALDFLSPETLAWNAVAGSQVHNLYRGFLSDLNDGNGDGDPDAGYGACVAQVTGTTHVDNDVPGPGLGYFYLKTVVDSGGSEVATGSTQGRARALTITCPAGVAPGVRL